MVSPVLIAGRRIGPGHPCFIIAEAGVNHNGDLSLAKRLIKSAAAAEADAVKFQTFRAERVMSTNAPKARYQVEAARAGESQLEMAKRLELPQEAFRELDRYCRERGIHFLSTPFDEESADFLAQLGVPAVKIPSGELTNLPLLERVARYGKPMIVSTGMSTLEEVRVAVEAIRGAGGRQIVLLHCTSRYPADPNDANLRAMRAMEEAFDLPVGYSDHTIGREVALAAIALGACMLEKHLTLDRTLPGPDHRISAEPGELAALVRGIRTVEGALGHGRKEPVATEAEIAAVARKSIVAVRHISAGTRLTEELMAIKRPGTGLPPAMRTVLVGRVSTQDIPAGALISLEMVR